MKTLRVVALITVLLSVGVVDAHATILGDILTKITNLKNLMPKEVEAVTFIQGYQKTNRISTAKILLQVWNGMIYDIIHDIDAATALGLYTTPLMEELADGPLAVMVIMEDTLTADDLGLTNAVNVLTSRSRYYVSGTHHVNDELNLIYYEWSNQSWEDFYTWLFWYGGIEYIDAINTEDWYYTSYYTDALIGGEHDYLQIYHPLDYAMPLSEYYGNLSQGQEYQANTHVLWVIIDDWILTAFQSFSNAMAYWGSMGATYWQGVLYWGPIMIVDERVLVLPENIYHGYYCEASFYSTDLGRTWVQSDDVQCYIV